MYLGIYIVLKAYPSTPTSRRQTLWATRTRADWWSVEGEDARQNEYIIIIIVLIIIIFFFFIPVLAHNIGVGYGDRFYNNLPCRTRDAVASRYSSTSKKGKRIILKNLPREFDLKLVITKHTVYNGYNTVIIPTRTTLRRFYWRAQFFFFHNNLVSGRKINTSTLLRC